MGILELPNPIPSTILYTLYEGKLFITIHWFLTHFLWSFIPIYAGDPFIFKSFNPHKRLLLKNNNHKDGGISLVLGIMYSNPVSISRVNIPRPKTTSIFYTTFTGGMISHNKAILHNSKIATALLSLLFP